MGVKSPSGIALRSCIDLCRSCISPATPLSERAAGVFSYHRISKVVRAGREEEVNFHLLYIGTCGSMRIVSSPQAYLGPRTQYAVPGRWHEINRGVDDGT